MQIRARQTLKQFWERHPSAEIPLRTWYAIVQKTAWSGPSDVKRQFGNAVDFVADNRVIFDIGGNKYRLIAVIHFNRGKLFVRHVLTHAEYDEGKWKNE